MSIQFQVDDVQMATEPLHTVDTKVILDNKLGKRKLYGELEKPPIEAWSNTPLINDTKHGLLSAIHMAFDQHRPLSLSPDAFWLTISGGLATHINLNAEKLRKKFVDFEGKKKIIVRRDHFVKGSPDNDWEGCFDEFSDKISDYIGKKRDLIVCNFSTTGVLEKAASEVVLMDAMQNYFDYICRTLCGFPSITLEGEPEDWQKLIDKASYMSEFGLEWWTDHLLPVLEKVKESAEGNVDKDFWRSLYKIGGGSGGPYVTGWVNTLFPYLVRDRKNPFVEKWNTGGGFSGNNPDDFPLGISSVPFVWEYLGTDIKMKFVAGLVGAAQDDDFTIRPQAGWAVMENHDG